MTYNILTDGGETQEHRRPSISEIIRDHDPDLLFMQEGGDSQEWEAFVEEMGYASVINQPGLYSPCLFSKFPLEDSLVKVSKIAGPGNIYACLRVSGMRLGLYNVHLPWRQQDDDERVATLKELIEHQEEMKDDGVIVAGDFNSRSEGEWGETWGREILAAHCSLEQGVGKDNFVAATSWLKALGYVDTFRHLHAEKAHSVRIPLQWMQKNAPDEQLPVLHDDGWGSPHWVRIDYIFCSPGLLDALVSCEIDDSPKAETASDHLPFVATFDFSRVGEKKSL